MSKASHLYPPNVPVVYIPRFPRFSHRRLPRFSTRRLPSAADQQSDMMSKTEADVVQHVEATYDDKTPRAGSIGGAHTDKPVWETQEAYGPAGIVACISLLILAANVFRYSRYFPLKIRLRRSSICYSGWHALRLRSRCRLDHLGDASVPREVSRSEQRDLVERVLQQGSDDGHDRVGRFHW